MPAWQVRAELPGGGKMCFGVIAPDRENAMAQAVQLLRRGIPAGIVTIVLEVTEIPVPAERLSCRYLPPRP